MREPGRYHPSLMFALSIVPSLIVTGLLAVARPEVRGDSAPKQDLSPSLASRLSRIESAFRQSDANALRLSFPASGKVRVDLDDLTDGQGSYGPGQLQVIFGQIFEDYPTREFVFERDEIRVSAPGTAFARSRWTRRHAVGGHESADTLTFTLRQEGKSGESRKSVRPTDDRGSRFLVTSTSDANAAGAPHDRWFALRTAAPLLAVLLAAADASWAPRLPALLLASALCLVSGNRRSWAWRLAGLTLLVGVASRVQALAEDMRSSAVAAERVQETLRGVEALKSRMVAEAESMALRAASLPEARRALEGDRAGFSALFAALEHLARGRPEAVAIHTPGSVTIAWAGAVGDPPGLPSLAGSRRDVFVVEGSVSTSLVATAPITAPDGRHLGLATAEVPLRVRRNIRNEFLSDFDRLADAFPGVEVEYSEIRSDGADGPPLLHRPAEASADLRGPGGALLGTVRALPSSPAHRKPLQAERYRRAESGLAVLACFAWMAAASGRDRTLRTLVGLTAVRALLLVLGPPWPGSTSPLLSADHYASPWLGPLLRSPLDLLFTTAWLSALTLSLAVASCRHAPATSRPWARATATLLALPLIAGIFACVADTVSNTPLDLESLSLLPRSETHLVLQVGLLLILGTGLFVLVALFAQAGPLPTHPGARIALAAFWLLVGGLAFRFWPRDVIGLPLVPAGLLVGLGALVGGARGRWESLVRSGSPGALAGLALVGMATLTALLHPSLVHFGEKNVRLQIERGYAHDVLRQPGWRTYVLEETRRRIDSLDLLEEDPPGPNPPGIEQLAFFVWAQTGLASFGFSSAVEIQDPRGAVVSRFALNLPSLEAAPRPLPASVQWAVTPERLPVGSAEERVVHARRLLV